MLGTCLRRGCPLPGPHDRSTPHHCLSARHGQLDHNSRGTLEAEQWDAHCRSDWEIAQRVAAKLASRRAALERGFAAQTREAVLALTAQHGRAGDRAQRERRSLHANAAHAATVEAMLGPQTPVVRCLIARAVQSNCRSYASLYVILHPHPLHRRPRNGSLPRVARNCVRLWQTRSMLPCQVSLPDTTLANACMCHSDSCRQPRRTHGRQIKSSLTTRDTSLKQHRVPSTRTHDTGP
jgi:hypothetical protein